MEHPGERTEAGRLGVALNSMLERIEEAFRAREASEERVRRFAADASHELRTPLTSIRGYAELWRAGALRGEEELAGAMRRMEQEASRMGRLVEDLLLLARLDQRRPLDQVPVSLDQLVADAVSDARAVEPDRPIELSAQPVELEGDEMRLRQVIGNLLANVRLHTPPASPVTVTVTAGGDVARLVVADTGPGLAPEVAAKVFERFYRADASRPGPAAAPASACPSSPPSSRPTAAKRRSRPSQAGAAGSWWSCPCRAPPARGRATGGAVEGRRPGDGDRGDAGRCQTRLADEVKAGPLTQAQADERAASLEQRVTDEVNRTGGPGHDGPGGDGPGGDGPGGGGPGRGGPGHGRPGGP